MKAPRNRCPESRTGRIIPLLGLVAVFLFPGPRSLQAQDARAIVERMDKNMRGDYSTQELTMTIVRPTWQRTISMKGWSVGQDYSMILITAPAREKGQVFLKREKEMWNWVPAIDRMIKIPPSMMMQSWMGSDFTNDDLIRESSVIDDYEHRLLGKGKGTRHILLQNRAHTEAGSRGGLGQDSALDHRRRLPSTQGRILR
jgi:hypothetical protein